MSSLWNRFPQFYPRHDALGFSIDISRIRFGDDFLANLTANLSDAPAACGAGPSADAFALF
jgi:hypothetical protein